MTHCSSGPKRWDCTSASTWLCSIQTNRDSNKVWKLFGVQRAVGRRMSSTALVREVGLTWSRHVPCPILREAWFAGTSVLGPPKLDAPKIEMLVEELCAPTIEVTGAPNLRSWRTSFPTERPYWERLMTITQQCPVLESLQLISRNASQTMNLSGFTQHARVPHTPFVERVVTPWRPRNPQRPPLYSRASPRIPHNQRLFLFHFILHPIRFVLAGSLSNSIYRERYPERSRSISFDRPRGSD